jgi:hypothetical protein
MFARNAFLKTQGFRCCAYGKVAAFGSASFIFSYSLYLVLLRILVKVCIREHTFTKINSKANRLKMFRGEWGNYSSV